MDRIRFLGLIRRVLAHHYLPIGLAFFAVLITAPSLNKGWVADDWIHRTLLLGNEPLEAAGLIDSGSHKLAVAVMHLFDWIRSDRIKQYMDYGVLPWWTFKGLVVSFWRPLSSLTHWLDYRLWPNSAALMHAHSLLWFGAFAGLAGLVPVVQRQDKISGAGIGLLDR